ncbi:hypothetical protein [Sphingobacterium sp. LRF_L2]|uniref:hypothetical protein n=1 Tax=Sphingobacterium sp. LRF_L2 TaxID=3369421 RepID=UPI003F630A53
MKTITITLIILLLLSCRTYKEKVQQESRSNALTEESKTVQHTYQWMQKDSLNRRWFFWTDTSFTYHPDSGLRAASGHLWMEESVTRSSDLQETVAESEKLLKQEEDYESFLSSKTVRIRSWYLYIGIGLLLIVICTMLWRKLKFF